MEPLITESTNVVHDLRNLGVDIDDTDVVTSPATAVNSVVCRIELTPDGRYILYRSDYGYPGDAWRRCDAAVELTEAEAEMLHAEVEGQAYGSVEAWCVLDEAIDDAIEVESYCD